MRDKRPKYDKYNTNRHVEGGEKVAAVPDKVEPVQAQPIEVKVYGNNFEKALKAFRAQVQKERVLSLYKEKQCFEKPSDKKRRKRAEMKRKRFELEKEKHGK